MSTSRNFRALVTGGGGFLGHAIVRRLLDDGHAVRTLARGDYPELAKIGVEHRRADLTDHDSVRAAAKGCNIVFHVAAKAGIWGPYAEYHRANVIGTQNVIDACKFASIGRLVYTSSPSVVFNGRDMEGVDESIPYPDHYDAPYPKTKALAEQAVLAANGRDLATVALRPHLIWGPGDTNLVPRIIARANRLRRIGGLNKLVDSIYIDNAADAHLKAAEVLSHDSPLAGRPYFISNDEPRPVWDLVGSILAAANLPPVTRSVPTWFARAAAACFETTFSALRLRSEPPMTKFLAHELTTAHWFNISAAKRDFGYEPKIAIDEGLRRLADWMSASRHASPTK